jgi:cell division protein FtsI/penicillin-binding protein 2
MKGRENLWRINLIIFIILIWGGIILARLVYLQIIHDDFYKALAKGQQEIVESILGPRGEIFLYDKDKLSVLATNKIWFLCYATPAQIENEERTALLLAENLGISKEELLSKFKKKEKLFVVLKRKVTDQEAEILKKLNLKGIYLKKERYRYYPYSDLASDILGFVDSQGKGRYGVEGYFDNLLTGKEAWIKKELNPFNFVKDLNDELFKGADIVLTIDKNIQFQAQRLLKKAKEELEIEGGQIIVIDPISGKILALADWPSFDPNQYAKIDNLEVFKNGAIQALFEPGSMFKPITMAAALDQKKITPDTTYIDDGFVKIGGRIIYNYKKRAWGKRTMSEVLEKSINTGAVFVESQIGDKIFLEYIKKFGIFEKTGVELEGEIFSLNLELQKGYKVNFATASFGQGIEVTPLNFVRAFSALANGGKILRLHIIEEIKENGKTKKIKPEIIREGIISEEALKQLTKMLVGVVERGYGKKAKIPGYYIAGKTGTSQIPYSSLGIKKLGYSEKTWQSFIGFFPAFDPKFVILVKLDNPKTATAEYSAAPVFKEMAQYIINYYQIPPDYE